MQQLQYTLNETDDDGGSIQSFMNTLRSVTSGVNGFVRITKKFNTDEYLLFAIIRLR